MAQFDERIIEPFTNTKYFGKNPGAQDATQENDQQDQPNSTGHADEVDPPDPPKQSSKANNNLNNQDDDRKEARIVSIWCLASAIGIILCHFTAGLLQVVGVPGVGTSTLGHLGDAVLSGVVVGGGTKPLHDLINLFDNSSNKKGSSNNQG